MAESLLSDTQWRYAKPRTTAYRINDGGDLLLQVKPNGLKYWQFRYTKPDGKEGLIQVGPCSKASLEQARLGSRLGFRMYVIPNEVAEMALAHAIRDKTESAHRRGDLFEKRRTMMQARANFAGQLRAVSDDPQ